MRPQQLRFSVFMFALLLLHACSGGSGQGLTTPNATSLSSSVSGSGAGSSCPGSAGESSSSRSSTSQGSGIEGSGSPRSKVSYGRIDTLTNSTLTVSHQTWDITHAAISIEGSPGAVSDLAPGQLVGVIGEPDGIATEVSYAPTIIGSVQEVSLQPCSSTSALLFVLNQQIEVTSNTQFQSGLDLQSIAAGDRLAISAIAHATEWLEATYIARAASASPSEVTGVAFIPDPAARELGISGLTVDYENATLKGFPTDDVASGNLVRVVGTAHGGSESTNPFFATEVDKLNPIPLGAPGDTVAVCGPITRFVSAADFDVAGVPTATAPSTMIDPFPEALELGADVCVSGSISDQGGILATLISVQQTADNIGGNITAIDLTADTITVLGKTLTLDSATKVLDARTDPIRRSRIAITDLVIGDYVRIALSGGDTAQATSAGSFATERIVRTVDLHAALLFGWLTSGISARVSNFNVPVQIAPNTEVFTNGIIDNGGPVYQCGDASDPCTGSEFLAGAYAWLPSVAYGAFKGQFQNNVLEATVAELIAS